MITLINGCSNTTGDDLNPGECWSDLYKEWSTDDVLNIAKSGQSNHSICRETIRHLELNNQLRFLEQKFIIRINSNMLPILIHNHQNLYQPEMYGGMNIHERS